MTSAIDMATRERAELAEYLATLTPKQWSAPSLCTGWSVKNVVAHMVSYDDLGVSGLVGRFAKGRVVNANDVGMREYSALSDEQLLEFLRTHTKPKGLTSGLGGMIGLVDGTIHHQDIRRALGDPRTIPLDRLAKIVPSIPSNPRLAAWRRIRGLRLRANDIEWTHGRGPEVTGPAEAVMMAISGRADAVSELDGAGVSLLESRLSAQRR
jgi:uncharacterized protein (TIGR03083 family)